MDNKLLINYTLFGEIETVEEHISQLQERKDKYSHLSQKEQDKADYCAESGNDVIEELMPFTGKNYRVCWAMSDIPDDSFTGFIFIDADDKVVNKIAY